MPSQSQKDKLLIWRLRQGQDRALLGPIKNPARNRIALRRKVSSCRQAQPGRPGQRNFIVKNCRTNYSAPASAEPEGKDLFNKCVYLLPKITKNNIDPESF